MGLKNFWKNKKVLITGNTGFKGTWLSCILKNYGSDLYGISLPNEERQFNDKIKKRLDVKSFYGDIGDSEFISYAFSKIKPEVIFHLAAQPLVYESYENPISTFQTNVIGTANILFESRKYNPQAIVNVTSDKCYENKESVIGYKEEDPKGGDDPYSASKGAAEIISHSIAKSFLHPKDILVANVRAGNVIGGGDFSENRLLPDAFNALNTNEKLIIRSPNAIRPWQHVLEPLFGYIEIAEGLSHGNKKFTGGWNFGPNDEGCLTVSELLTKLKDIEKKLEIEIDEKNVSKKETKILKLSIHKALNNLKWSPKLDVSEALTFCSEWNKAFMDNCDLYDFTQQQIKTYILK